MTETYGRCPGRRERELRNTTKTGTFNWAMGDGLIHKSETRKNKERRRPERRRDAFIRKSEEARGDNRH